MAYTLKPGISFCQVAGRTVFLDLPADRYFCLSPDAEHSFARLASGASPQPEDARILKGLEMRGVLRAGEAGTVPSSCPAVPEAHSSLLDAAPVPASPNQTLLAALALMRAPLQLRLFGLRAAIARLRTRKARLKSKGSEQDKLKQSAAAFARLRAITTTNDQCLPRSLTVAERLFAAGVSAELVLAVKLQPFAAHAWVQWRDIVVNDRVDAVRDFTPILVV